MSLKPRYEGLVREGLKGLSIVILEALALYRQIVKAICRQIDKPYIPISPIAPYQRFEGLSSPLKNGEYKRYTNIPIDIQTISSGYKGLDNMLDKRFGYKGLKGLKGLWFFYFRAANNIYTSNQYQTI